MFARLMEQMLLAFLAIFSLFTLILAYCVAYTAVYGVFVR